MWPRVEGWVASISPGDWLDRLMMPSLTETMITILALVIVIATCLIIVLARYH